MRWRRGPRASTAKSSRVEAAADPREPSTKMPRTPFSVCVVAFEEEDRLGECLASVPFADEIVVVDSHSTDRTREIASLRGARVIERDWPGHVAQKEFAIRAASNDWVLCLDADERISPSLRREIEEFLASGSGGTAGCSMPRLTNYLGKWIRHGGFYPDRKVRLFDRRRGRWGGVDPHDRVEIEGPVRRLSGEILHFPYRDLEEHLRTIDRYTDIMARELARRGRRARLWDPPLHGAVRFARFYLLKHGFLDGREGLLLARLAARYGYRKYAKLRNLAPGSPPPPAGKPGRAPLPAE